MKIGNKLIILTLSLTLAGNLVRAEDEISTHIYNHYAIRSISTPLGDDFYKDEVILLKSEFKENPVNKELFKVPNIGETVWKISAENLIVPEEACLAVDATLCDASPKSEKKLCYSNCITNGPEFVSFDEKNEIIYIDAGSNIFGTGGTPRFLFAANIKDKTIKYLNTFVAPYTAYLSPNGKYLALDGGWNEITVCNTKTGNFSEAYYEDEYQPSKNYSRKSQTIQWLNDKELQYSYIKKYSNAQAFPKSKVLKIYNAETNKTTVLEQ